MPDMEATGRRIIQEGVMASVELVLDGQQWHVPFQELQNRKIANGVQTRKLGGILGPTVLREVQTSAFQNLQDILGALEDGGNNV